MHQKWKSFLQLEAKKNTFILGASKTGLRSFLFRRSFILLYISGFTILYYTSLFAINQPIFHLLKWLCWVASFKCIVHGMYNFGAHLKNCCDYSYVIYLKSRWNICSSKVVQPIKFEFFMLLPHNCFHFELPFWQVFRFPSCMWTQNMRIFQSQ